MHTLHNTRERPLFAVLELLCVPTRIKKTPYKTQRSLTGSGQYLGMFRSISWNLSSGIPRMSESFPMSSNVALRGLLRIVLILVSENPMRSFSSRLVSLFCVRPSIISDSNFALHMSLLFGFTLGINSSQIQNGEAINPLRILFLGCVLGIRYSLDDLLISSSIRSTMSPVRLLPLLSA